MSEQLVVTLIQANSNTNVSKRGGGTYPGALLVYNVNGQVYSKGIHEKVLTAHPDLKDKIKSFENKTNVQIVLVREKVGDFINILDIREAKPGEQSSPMAVGSNAASSSSSSEFEALSARVDAIEERVAKLEGSTDNRMPF